MLNEKQIEQIKKLFPRGTEVKLVETGSLKDVDYGKHGIVDYVDDMGIIHAILELKADFDKFEIVKVPANHNISDSKVAIKSGYYFMIFEKGQVPFFDELKRTEKIISKDGKEYYLYEAPTWDVAQKVDAFMVNNDLGYDIDDYLVNDVKI